MDWVNEIDNGFNQDYWDWECEERTVTSKKREMDWSNRRNLNIVLLVI